MNNVPDKIYIHRKDNPLEITWSEIEEKGCSNEEYIRKDALLEWAKEKYKHPDWLTIKDTGHEYWGQMVAFQEIIEKLESL